MVERLKKRDITERNERDKREGDIKCIVRLLWFV